MPVQTGCAGSGQIRAFNPAVPVRPVPSLPWGQCEPWGQGTLPSWESKGVTSTRRTVLRSDCTAAAVNAPEADFDLAGSCPGEAEHTTSLVEFLPLLSSPFFSPSDFSNLKHSFPPWQEGQGEAGLLFPC